MFLKGVSRAYVELIMWIPDGTRAAPYLIF